MRLTSGLFALVLLTSAVRAEQPRDPRAALAEQLTAELETLARTVDTVDGKVSDAEAARLRRIRSAYRILRTPLAGSGESSDADRMANARRRAAARLLLERDRAERELLADEVKQLRAAETTLHAAADAELPALVLPTSLLTPTKGTIARRFGTIVHDRSKATLARRGIDFEVATAAQVVAPADGVVRYAGPMRGLDAGILIDHGDYMTVLAKLGPLAIPAGTKLLRGDRVGRSARQRVYFEVRAKVGPGGLPIDPEPLLGK